MKNRYILTPYFLDRARSGLEPLAGPAWQVNRITLPDGSDRQRMVAIYKPLAMEVADAIQTGERPVSIAGDCCTTIGVLAGLQQANVNPILIWFDAHGDFNTHETTPSGFLGGMPLAMLTGRGEQTLVEGAGLQPFPEAQIILTDARDLDPGEREAVTESAMTHLRRVEDLLEMELPPGPLYVHFDVDVLNPEELPAVGYPATGGPSASTVGRVFERLAATGRIAAVSVTTWNPELDAGGRGQALVMSLVQKLVGE